MRRRHDDKQAGETTLPLSLPVNSTINVVCGIVKQIACGVDPLVPAVTKAMSALDLLAWFSKEGW